jgi:cyclic pyranopterin monophosphate synthase
MLSHLDSEGLPHMVDVSGKQATTRIARAEARVRVGQDVLRHLEQGEIQTAKGAVFQTAILAGIMGAKRTADLIPLCHSLPLEQCSIDIVVNANQDIVIFCTVQTTGKTGVEMEALTGASIAALTVYDMCKALSHDIVIQGIILLEKRGGKQDFMREVGANH